MGLLFPPLAELFPQDRLAWGPEFFKDLCPKVGRQYVDVNVSLVTFIRFLLDTKIPSI